jgi:hypothetical protein
MKNARYILKICSIAVYCAVAPATFAHAEFVADLYGGGSFTNNADVDVTSSLGGSSITLQGITFHTSWTAGGRLGYWFKEFGNLGAFGMGLDVFAFQPEAFRLTAQLTIGSASLGPFQIGSIKMSTVGIGFDVLRFRLHLAKSEELQNGRIQPYLSVGPALFITETSDENVFPPNQSSTKTSLGVKAGAGLNVHLTPAWSLFGEYRFTHFTSEATFHSAPPFAVSEITTKTDLNTHHVVGGFSFHF